MPLILPKRGILRPPRGAFAFPGSAPRPDVSRNGLIFAAVPLGGTFISLLQGAKAGAVGGTAGQVNPAMHGLLGPCLSFPALAQAASTVTFSGNLSTNLTSSTIAAIVAFNAFTATQYVFANSTGSSGVAMNVSSAGVLTWTMFGSSAKASTITLAVNVPYFILASQNGSTAVDFLAMRMDTGVVATNSQTGAVPTAPNGTFAVGNGPANNNPANGLIAAAAFLSGYNSLPVLRQLANDPWGLWYAR